MSKLLMSNSIFVNSVTELRSISSTTMLFAMFDSSDTIIDRRSFYSAFEVCEIVCAYAINTIINIKVPNRNFIKI